MNFTINSWIFPRTCLWTFRCFTDLNWSSVLTFVNMKRAVSIIARAVQVKHTISLWCSNYPHCIVYATHYFNKSLRMGVQMQPCYDLFRQRCPLSDTNIVSTCCLRSDKTSCATNIEKFIIECADYKCTVSSPNMVYVPSCLIRIVYCIKISSPTLSEPIIASNIKLTIIKKYS